MYSFLKYTAVSCLRLYYRSIEFCKSQALSSHQDFERLKSLSPQTLSDLNWMTDHLARLDGNYFGPRPKDITIECDASLVGWGALSQGENVGLN